jgi:hypothetical protein
LRQFLAENAATAETGGVYVDVLITWTLIANAAQVKQPRAHIIIPHCPHSLKDCLLADTK